MDRDGDKQADRWTNKWADGQELHNGSTWSEIEVATGSHHIRPSDGVYVCVPVSQCVRVNVCMCACVFKLVCVCQCVPV